MPRASDPEFTALFTPGDPEVIFSDLKEIGHGSFGNVYFARQVENNDIVAIKKMAYSGKNSNDKLQDIIKEIKFLQQCDHRNCVHYKGCYLKGHVVWLSMEYCLGSAADIIEVHKKPLEECEIAAMIKDSLSGLEYIHANNMIHRDVKAGNILITAGGRVKLADFGSASLVSPANSFVGTPYWMAPEVILAMDESYYDARVDIWSLGITCIELSEGKPPLFNMNAMAALYHIAQNESPRLGEGDDVCDMQWSTSFKDFIACCLIKNHLDRPNSTELLKHPWMVEAEPETVLSILVARTKDAVRRLDSKNYRAAKKIFMLNNANAENGETEVEADMDTSSTGSTGSLQDPDSVEYDSDNEERYNGGNGTNQETESGYSDHEMSERRNSVVEVGEDTTPHEAITFSQINPIVPSVDLRRDFKPSHEGFSTIKPNATLSKQMIQNNPENEIKNQMLVYKQMRQQNMKQLRQLEQRHKVAADEQTRLMERDIEVLVTSNDKELEKLRSKARVERDTADKEEHTDQKRFIKSLQERYETTQKNRIGEVKKAYSKQKEQLKKDFEQTPKQSRKVSLDVSKDKLKRSLTETEEVYLHQVQQQNEEELKNYRQTSLKQRHAMEQSGLQEEWNLLEVHRESLARLHIKQHHDLMTSQEMQLGDIHTLRQRHTEAQHKAEWDNQIEYTQRVEKELRRKHMMELRQQPKSLKKKELQIKKQFQDTLKIIENQYKELLKDYLKNTAKEYHKEVMRKVKEDKMRKMARLQEQYNQSINEHLEREQVNLSESQQQEGEALRQKLQKEQELLQAYQEKVHERLARQNSIEQSNFRSQSDKRLETLKSDLLKAEQDFAAKRHEAESQQHARQRKELTDFQGQEHTLNRSTNLLTKTWGRRSMSPWTNLRGAP